MARVPLSLSSWVPNWRIAATFCTAKLHAKTTGHPQELIAVILLEKWARWKNKTTVDKDKMLHVPLTSHVACDVVQQNNPAHLKAGENVIDLGGIKSFTIKMEEFCSAILRPHRAHAEAWSIASAVSLGPGSPDQSLEYDDVLKGERNGELIQTSRAFDIR